MANRRTARAEVARLRALRKQAAVYGVDNPWVRWATVDAARQTGIEVPRLLRWLRVETKQLTGAPETLYDGAEGDEATIH